MVGQHCWCLCRIILLGPNALHFEAKRDKPWNGRGWWHWGITAQYYHNSHVNFYSTLFFVILCVLPQSHHFCIKNRWFFISSSQRRICHLSLYLSVSTLTLSALSSFHQVYLIKQTTDSNFGIKLNKRLAFVLTVSCSRICLVKHQPTGLSNVYRLHSCIKRMHSQPVTLN